MAGGQEITQHQLGAEPIRDNLGVPEGARERRQKLLDVLHSGSISTAALDLIMASDDPVIIEVVERCRAVNSLSFSAELSSALESSLSEGIPLAERKNKLGTVSLPENGPQVLAEIAGESNLVPDMNTATEGSGGQESDESIELARRVMESIQQILTESANGSTGVYKKFVADSRLGERLAGWKKALHDRDNNALKELGIKLPEGLGGNQRIEAILNAIPEAAINKAATTYQFPLLDEKRRTQLWELNRRDGDNFTSDEYQEFQDEVLRKLGVLTEGQSEDSLRIRVNEPEFIKTIESEGGGYNQYSDTLVVPTNQPGIFVRIDFKYDMFRIYADLPTTARLIAGAEELAK